MNPTDLSGFDPRVQEQLAQLSLDQDSRSNLSSSRSASRSSYHSVSRQPLHHHNHTQYNTQPHPTNMNTYSYSSPWDGSGPDAFPPLGATRPAPPSAPGPAINMHVNRNYRPQHQNQGSPASTAAQDFFSRARGNSRGRGRPYRQDNNDFSRASRQNNNRPAQNQSWTSHDQNRGVRHRAMDQADYLAHLAQNTITNMLSTQEIDQKHHFRQTLEALARNLSETHPSLDPDPKSLNLRLQSYGSLSNSFGTSGCDVDLLLTVEKTPGDYVDITEQYKLDLEQTLLDLGIGARLLTNTRIPIIRVCERPAPALLDNLRQHRKQRDAASLAAQFPSTLLDLAAPLPLLPKSQNEQQLVALADLDPTAADVPLPRTPVMDHAKLEFGGDCGIQCDINFTNHVALHNTKMLWTYGQCDVRVRHMGIFVKNWAKARAINTPYHGTLSSYGYVLMVLHYLINVANPPVIPNLQDMAIQDSWGGRTLADSFEGYDIRFVKDLNRVRGYMANSPKNQNSLGALLHGFFRYYASHDGFNWTHDVISIRNRGGVLSKQSKEWTGAKWTGDKQNVRLRYLLAIEDPFELEHNVARTVGHNGIKAIRDEFRRSWAMIQGIQRVQGINGTSWVWTALDQSSSGDGLDFIKPSEDRGDLLKKDADFRKEQMRLLKQKTETEEELARKQTLTGTSDDGQGDSYGMSVGSGHPLLIDCGAEDQAKLIHDVQLQDRKVTRMRGPDSIYRTTTADEDDMDRDISSGPEWHATSHEGSYSNHANDWPTAADIPASSEIGSDDWATAYESNSPPAKRLDRNLTDKMANEQNQWDSWTNSPTSENHDNLSSDGNTALHRIEPIDWNAPLTHDRRVTEAEKDASFQPFADWSIPIDQSNTEIDAAIPEPPSPRTKRRMRISQLPPQSLDDIPQLSQDTSTQQMDPSWYSDRQNPKPDRVGSFIEWSSESMGGRWLLTRDARIRAGGTIEITAGRKGYLNAKFPYDPEMTHQQLAEKNEQLEKYYKSSLHPRQSSDMQSQNLAAENAVVRVPSLPEQVSWNELETGNSKANIDKIIDAGLIGDGIHWSTLSGVGSWLCWRDRKILAGSWNSRAPLSSLLNELFPRDPSTTVGDQRRMNWELDTFFAGLDYPRSNELTHEEMNEAANAIRDAVRCTQEHRASKSSAMDDQPQGEQAQFLQTIPSSNEKSRHFERSAPPEEIDEAVDLSSQQPVQSQPTATKNTDSPRKTVSNNEQSKILLDMFKLGGGVSPKTTRHTLDPENRDVINARSMQAVMNLSEQLSKNSKEDANFVRARRVAYYSQPQQVDEATESIPVETPYCAQVVDFGNDRRDSATEGSWNKAQSSSYDIEKLRQDDSFW